MIWKELRFKTYVVRKYKKMSHFQPQIHLFISNMWVSFYIFSALTTTQINRVLIFQLKCRFKHKNKTVNTKYISLFKINKHVKHEKNRAFLRKKFSDDSLKHFSRNELEIICIHIFCNSKYKTLIYRPPIKVPIFLEIKGAGSKKVSQYQSSIIRII